MSETILAHLSSATPLAALLATPELAPQLSDYRGVLTPLRLDVQERETAALALETAVHDLGWLRRVEVRGEDRFRWLSGMVTNMVNDLAANSGAWNLVLNAQGRIQGDMTVWREGDRLFLEIAADQYDRLMAHLDHFIIMDDVELIPYDAETTVLGLTGPRAGEVLTRLGLPTLTEPLATTRAEWNGLGLRISRNYGVIAEHYAIAAPVTALDKLWKFVTAGGAIPVGSAALESFRIAEGIPAYGIDIVERDLAQETSQMRALSFSKGCYLGQEIVERIRSRGNVHRHLRSLEVDGPLPAVGAELLLDGIKTGHLTSVTELPLPGGPRRFALGMIRAEAELRNLPMIYTAAEAQGTARLLPAPPTF